MGTVGETKKAWALTTIDPAPLQPRLPFVNAGPIGGRAPCKTSNPIKKLTLMLMIKWGIGGFLQ